MTIIALNCNAAGNLVQVLVEDADGSNRRYVAPSDIDATALAAFRASFAR